MEFESINQEKLAELMSNGWSWHGGGSGSNSSSDVEYMTAETTGKRYKLHIKDGNLTMTEVTA